MHAPVLGGVPRLDSGFTGRETLLEQIHEGLSSHAGARFLVDGGSGVGKSQLAAAYVHRYARHYDLVWWVTAVSDVEAHRSFLRLAEHIGLPVSFEHVPRTVQTVRRALADDPGIGRWLLVFDDASDVEALAADYFPLGGQGRVLITTRSPRRIPRGLVGGRVVPRLDTAESLSLLRGVCPDRLEPSSAGERLAEHLEHLPLALAQVGAFLRDSPLTTEEFLDRFTERHADLVSRMGAEDDHTAPLAAAWSIQAEELRRERPGSTGRIGRMALELVQISAFLAPGPIPRALFSRAEGLGGDPDQRCLLGEDHRLGEVLAYLGEHHLVRYDEEAGTFQLHELFQTVTRNALPLAERLRYWELAQLILTRSDPGDPADPAHRDAYLALYAHVKSTKAWSSRDPRVRDLVLNVVDFLTEAGSYDDAVKLVDQSVNAWRDDEGRVLHARLRRNRIRRIHGEYETALAEARELHERQARSSPDGEEPLEAHRAVALALSGLARFDEAERIFQHILDRRRTLHTESDPQTLDAAHDYGRVLQEQGRFSASLAVDERNAELRARLLGEDSVPTLRTELSLGLNLVFLGRLEEARDRIDACMRRFAAIAADDGPHALHGLLFLSVIHRRLGEYEAALEHSSRALDLYGRRHPPTVRQMLYCRVVHMVTLCYAGEQDQALREAEQLPRPLNERYPKEHPFLATSRVSAAIVLRASRRYSEALQLDRDGLEHLRGVYGQGALSTLPAALNLATDLYALDRVEEARELDASVERICRDRLPDGHPTMLTARRNHLVSRRAAGADVEREWERLCEDYTARFGPGHPSVASLSSFVRENCDTLSLVAL
ncbi:tetratricopeptide repeat protein [Nocardiopsis sp. Huas11]|nr:tetratricopeptide repeat protein [Nocardiopsis sp. Huas11]